MTHRWSAWASLALLASTQACLASKNDIRLLQDELRVSRAAEAHADSARAAQGDSLRRVLLENAHTTDNLFAAAMQMSRATAESLAVLSNRFMDFSANTRETLDQSGQERHLGRGDEPGAGKSNRRATAIV